MEALDDWKQFIYIFLDIICGIGVITLIVMGWRSVDKVGQAQQKQEDSIARMKEYREYSYLDGKENIQTSDLVSLILSAKSDMFIAIKTDSRSFYVGSKPNYVSNPPGYTYVDIQNYSQQDLYNLINADTATWRCRSEWVKNPTYGIQYNNSGLAVGSNGELEGFYIVNAIN